LISGSGSPTRTIRDGIRLWRDQRLVIETDGYGSHRSKRAFGHDRKRDIELELHGYNVRRFTHDQARTAAIRIPSRRSRA
jgi:very-short-patch-repair endonuclease